MKNLKPALKKLNPKTISAEVIILVFAVLGVHLLISSHAQSPYASTRADQGILASPATTKVCTGSSDGSCVQFGQPPGYFNVSGNQILQSDGKPYIPLGVTVFGISQTDWQSNIGSDIAQINASASFWHANIVRIQVAPYYLNNNTTGYLAAIEQEVTVAEKAGLNVIISAQYENTKSLYPLGAPDSSTVQFWNTIAPIYASDNRVWFDLYNEPYADKPYSVWKSGGTVNGVKYVGMQTLVNNIRSVAPHNVIVAESIDNFQHLQGITGYSLSGGNIVYSVHPYFDIPANLTLGTPPEPVTAPQPVTWWQQNAWSPAWGNFASQYPIIIGEWGEHETTKNGCQTNASQLVPPFLSYISSLHLGLIGWSLTPGAMIDGSNLEKPNTFTGGPYSCSTNPDNAQGAGADMLQYFTSGGVYNN